MPSSRPNPSSALPANRLRVGECVADIPSREIVRADGTRSRITVKSMAVLLLLVEGAGQVVSREQLLESAWVGTLPTDDVLTQAITQLRKALGDDRDARPMSRPFRRRAIDCWPRSRGCPVPVMDRRR